MCAFHSEVLVIDHRGTTAALINEEGRVAGLCCLQDSCVMLRRERERRVIIIVRSSVHEVICLSDALP